MLDDLIFKGKNLDEALSKASNFFGVDREVLVYVCLEDSPEGEVRIQLTENPNAQLLKEKLPEQKIQRARPVRRPDRRMDAPGPRLQPRHRNRRVERYQTSGQRAKPQYNSGGHRSGGWQQEETDTSWMNPAEREAFKFVVDTLRRMRMRLAVNPVQDQSRLVFNIVGPDRNIFLTKKGAALTALQYLVNKIFMNRGEATQKIFIDSQGYRVAREEELREIALRSADKVRKSQKEYCLTPMNPYERRLIHLALKDDGEVVTVSRGEGFIKQVSILPISMAESEGLLPREGKQAEDQ